MQLVQVGKKAAMEAQKKLETEEKNKKIGQRPVFSLAAPPLQAEINLIDGSFYALNRQFERDIIGVVTRAQENGIGMVISTSDFGKTKEMMDFCKQWSGLCYATVGIHPDNIKRVHNISVFSTQMEELLDFALAEEAVALQAGLDLSREVSTHFIQEKLLVSHLEIARRVHLPIVIQVISALAADKIREERAKEVAESDSALSVLAATKISNPGASLVENFLMPVAISAIKPSEFSDQLIELVVKLGCFLHIDASITVESEALFWKDLISKLPKEKLLLVSNAPHCTPQNIEDSWIRQNRNEPVNITSTVDFYAELFQMKSEELKEIFIENARCFYGLDEEDVLLEEEEKVEPLPQEVEIKESIDKELKTSKSKKESKKESKKSKKSSKSSKYDDSDDSIDPIQELLAEQSSDDEVAISKKKKKNKKLTLPSVATQAKPQSGKVAENKSDPDIFDDIQTVSANKEKESSISIRTGLDPKLLDSMKALQLEAVALEQERIEQEAELEREIQEQKKLKKDSKKKKATTIGAGNFTNYRNKNY